MRALFLQRSGHQIRFNASKKKKKPVPNLSSSTLPSSPALIMKTPGYSPHTRLRQPTKESHADVLLTGSQISPSVQARGTCLPLAGEKAAGHHAKGTHTEDSLTGR